MKEKERESLTAINVDGQLVLRRWLYIKVASGTLKLLGSDRGSIGAYQLTSPKRPPWQGLGVALIVSHCGVKGTGARPE